MSKEIRELLKDMEKKDKRIEEEFLEMESDLKELKTEVNSDSDVGQNIGKALRVTEGDKGIKQKIKELHNDLDRIEDGDLNKSPKKLFEDIHLITDEAAGQKGEMNEASLQTLERLLDRAKRAETSEEVENKIIEMEQLVSDQFDMLLDLRREIKLLV